MSQQIRSKLRELDRQALEELAYAALIQLGTVARTVHVTYHMSQVGDNDAVNADFNKCSKAVCWSARKVYELVGESEVPERELLQENNVRGGGKVLLV